jgi:hypothetical protein
MENVVAVPACRLKGNKVEAFEHENSAFFCVGFMWQRWKSQLSGKQKTELPDLEHSVKLSSSNLQTAPDRESFHDGSQAA